MRLAGRVPPPNKYVCTYVRAVFGLFLLGVCGGARDEANPVTIEKPMCILQQGKFATVIIECQRLQTITAIASEKVQGNTIYRRRDFCNLTVFEASSHPVYALRYLVHAEDPSEVRRLKLTTLAESPKIHAP